MKPQISPVGGGENSGLGQMSMDIKVRISQKHSGAVGHWSRSIRIRVHLCPLGVRLKQRLAVSSANNPSGTVAPDFSETKGAQACVTGSAELGR